jgi:5-methylthioribose kinase
MKINKDPRGGSLLASPLLGKATDKIVVTEGVVKFIDQEYSIYHILTEPIFLQMANLFNNTYITDPKNFTDVKPRFIKFLNKKFNLQVAFKSREHFYKFMNLQTIKLAKAQIPSNQ